MKCDFCGREVERGTLECPYCHYRFKIDPTVLTPDERDTFEGVTIEQDGSTSDGQERGDNASGSVTGAGGRGYDGGDFRQTPRIKVHTFNSFGCGSGLLLLTLLIVCGILALIFFLLPVFFIYALVGAVVVSLLKFFGGLF